MIEIVPVVTLGELITPIAICTVGFTQCLLIYMGMRRMDRASEERRQQIEQHRRQLDQQQETLDRQFELHRQALDQQREALNRQLEQQQQALEQQQQALDQQGEILRDVGRGIQELIRRGQQTP